MKKIILMFCAAVLVFAAGCSFYPAIDGSGFPKTMSFDSTGFVNLAVEHPFKVSIVPDTVFSVSVTCDDNIIPYLVVELGTDTLKLGLMDGYNYRQVILAAEVHMPALTGLTMSGASEARIEPGFVSSQPLSVTLSGASTAEFAAVGCGPLTTSVSGASTFTATSISSSSFTATVSGASTVTASGSTNAEYLIVSGASGTHLRSLAATQASVQLSGSSKSWVNVGSGQITLTASGASTLYFVGNPTFVKSELSGGSGVQKL
jgi:hypothetical protein